mgnify:CR=1 FL=1
MFDSHCHPQFPHYDQDRDEMIKRTLKEGVFMICVGTDFEASKKAIKLAGEYDGIWATVGLHPNDNLKEKFNPEIYENLLNQEKVIGFGEIGLDYYRTEKSEDQKIQKQRFQEQLELARKISKPLVIHCRDAHKDLIENLKLKIENSTPLRGVIHSFTGTLEEAKKYLELGFYLSFNGIITFANQYDEVVKVVPLEKILLETDAPYLTPIPFRGQRNEPLYVKYVAQKIAELKGISYDEVAEKTFANTQKLFGIRIK